MSRPRKSRGTSSRREPAKSPPDASDSGASFSAVDGNSELNYERIEEAIRDGEIIPYEVFTKLVLEGSVRGHMVDFDSEGIRMTPEKRAAAYAAHRENPEGPPLMLHYRNPYQSTQYLIIDALSSQTFVSSAIYALVTLVMGTGFRPEIYLLHSSGDDAIDAAELKKYAWVTDVMEAADNRIRLGGSSFFDLVRELVRCTIVYNRAMLVMDGAQEPLTVNGITYTGIPSSLEFVHARDMGTNYMDHSGGFTGVQWYPKARKVKWPDMIYLWNSRHGDIDSHTNWYGYSSLKFCMPQLRSIFEFGVKDAPVGMKSSYVGSVKIPPNVSMPSRQPKAPEMGQVDYTVDWHEPVHAKAFEQLLDIQYRIMCSGLGIPYDMVSDKSVNHRAAMMAKLDRMTTLTIRPMREWINRKIAPQWYGIMLEQILRAVKQEGLHEVIGVRMAWDSPNTKLIESQIEIISKLDQMLPLNRDRA